MPFESVKDVCCPAVDGSRSIVPVTMLLPGPNAVSLAVISGSVTGVLKGVVAVSSRARGGVGTFVAVCVAVGVLVGVCVEVGVFVEVLVGVFV